MAPVASRSLWSETAAPAVPATLLTGALRAHVIIIGGGYTGLSAALHLGAAGRDVIVLEAVEIGERASGSNGGQVIPGVKLDPDDLEAALGPELGPRLVATVAGTADAVFELIQQHRIECDPVRTGWIQLATSEGALGPLRARCEQWRRRGAPVQLLDRRQAQLLTGSERYSGGWIDRRAGTIQPLAYVRGLARAALGQGARIFQRSPVMRLARESGQWRVETPAGSVVAPLVILATGAYTDRIADDVRRTVVAIPSLQVATEPIPPALRQSILPGGQAVSDTWHLLRYFRLDASGRLVMGSRGSFSRTLHRGMVRHHYRAVREIYPQLAGLRFEYHWGGLVAMTRDHLPHLHEVAPGLLAGLGYNGRGVAMATVMGRVLARRALGCPAAELGFPVTPVQPIAFHGWSRLGARAAIQYLRMRDALTRLHERRSP